MPRVVPRKAQKTVKSPALKTMMHAVAMTLFVAAAMLIMACCVKKPVMAHAHFKHLPAAGWQPMMPLTFKPVYDDSTARYDIALVVRHDNSYRYRNLPLVADVIGAEGARERKTLDLALADEFGNWTGGGFGALYQNKAVLSQGLKPVDARSVVVWLAMPACDTLCGITDVGIITTPQ